MKFGSQRPEILTPKALNHIFLTDFKFSKGNNYNTPLYHFLDITIICFHMVEDRDTLFLKWKL